MKDDEIYIHGVGSVKSGRYKKDYVAQKLQEEYAKHSDFEKMILKYRYQTAVEELGGKFEE